MTARIDLAEVAAIAARRLGLRPIETRILHNCLWAREQVPNGHFLVPGGSVPSARRLIERGYIMQTEQQPEPFDPKFGLVVCLEQQHWDKLIADANATRTARS
jgi:hypothetical protein